MVEILDSTLREGEQTPGVTFSVKEKVHIAQLMDEFGVDFIEAGHPSVSNDVKKGIQAVAKEDLNANILAHSRTLRSDVDKVLECDVNWIGMFFSLADNRLENQFRKDITDVAGLVADVVQYAKDHGLNVRYTPEDTMRSDYNKVVYVAKAALEAGADRISVADTVGAANPFKMKAFIQNLKKDTGAEINVHCHNDLGLAVANALAAFEGGAVLIDTCVNGLGERAGITNTSELCLALNTLYGINKWKLGMLPKISKTVEKYSGFNIARNAPIVGQNAFAHNAGLHVAAALMDPSFYEVFPAEMLGRKRRYVMDKMSSRKTAEHALKQNGFKATEEQVNYVMDHVKNLEKGELNDVQLKELVRASVEDT